MAGALRLTAALLLLGLACAPRLPAPSLPSESRLLSGRGRIVLSAGRYGISAPCAFVLDEDLGRARMEIREPLGTTRLVLFLSPSEALLWDPASGAWASWREPSEVLPFAPADLWAALRAVPPAGARGRIEGRGWSASWRNGSGRVRGRFADREGTKEVLLEGPHRSRLELRAAAAPAEPLAAGVLNPPEVEEGARIPPARLLGEGIR